MLLKNIDIAINGSPKAVNQFNSVVTSRITNKRASIELNQRFCTLVWSVNAKADQRPLMNLDIAVVSGKPALYEIYHTYRINQPQQK